MVSKISAPQAIFFRILPSKNAFFTCKTVFLKSFWRQNLQNFRPSAEIFLYGPSFYPPCTPGVPYKGGKTQGGKNSPNSIDMPYGYLTEMFENFTKLPKMNTLFGTKRFGRATHPLKKLIKIVPNRDSA